MARDFAAVGKLDEAVLSVDAHAGGALGDKLCAESRSLGMRAPAELCARDARREAEVVFDP